MMMMLLVSMPAFAQRPNRRPGGGGGGGVNVDCSASFNGHEDYVGQGPKAAPLRGTVACVDTKAQNLRQDGREGELIYGPFEAGFAFDQLQQFFGCTNSDAVVPGGVDTLLAEKMVAFMCSLNEADVSVLDYCGGHANPFHYHEKMQCLYESDPTTQHSTRVGTALDGNGIYGKYVEGGKIPTDLDACGGRFGVTPDSNGEEVYYYVLQDTAPFTVGCFGPATLDECRALYTSCGNGDILQIETNDGIVEYDTDCPCFDSNGSNIGSSETSKDEDDSNDGDKSLEQSSGSSILSKAGRFALFLTTSFFVHNNIST